ncbi:unnamed protein product, partial [marine sediment metagenome]
DEDKRRLEIYNSLAEKNISLDMFTISPGILIFTLNSEYKEKAIEILNKLNVNFRLRENCAKISLVGTRIHGVPGIMAKIANSLYKEKIKICPSCGNKRFWHSYCTLFNRFPSLDGRGKGRV